MELRAFPAAFGFLAVACSGDGQSPKAAFATSGTHSLVQEQLRQQNDAVLLVHPPGLPADRAHARDQDTFVVLAGEIYNHEELLGLLPDGAEPSGDAELVLKLLGRYGHHAFRLINGRFAAMVGTGRQVLLATDHAGSVPLYVRPSPGEVSAATEAKALAPHGRPQGTPIPGAQRVRRVPGAFQVPAGTVLEIDLPSGTARSHPTWTPPLHRRIMSEDDAVGAVREALERAVRTRIAPGSTPFVVLSGGIDSSGVAALAHRSAGALRSVSMGTDVSDEFDKARIVADHLGSAHQEITIHSSELLAQLPHTVWASESLDPEIIEYLLPLTALYRVLDGPRQRILTGYGADIPLAGMHREDRLPSLDTAVVGDMSTFDGLNEMSPVLSGISGHWSTHPYWDREVLDLLVSLEAGLKYRYRRDKWVLRAAMGDVLPRETVTRPKLGVHEGSGTTSSFSRLLAEHGVPEQHLGRAKRRVVEELFDRTVVAGVHPDETDTGEVVRQVAAGLRKEGA
ncbi:asparagine synthase-related protein [Streptomyces sp. NPDC058231]|uniref:asparagine synthase-related protein n=1 Tax=Streptomyces sp. NPDC058231 TaxID=3346392 RepID=UPI0036E9B3A1